MRLVCKLTESHKTISGDLVAFDCNVHLLDIFQIHSDACHYIKGLFWKLRRVHCSKKKRGTERNRSMVNSGRLKGFCFCVFHRIKSGQRNSCLGFSWEISLGPHVTYPWHKVQRSSWEKAYRQCLKMKESTVHHIWTSEA